MFELLIVGAGPHALTLICRLLEQDADASVDAPYREARSRAALLRSMQQAQGGGTSVKARSTALTQWLHKHVVVVDPQGRWNARWDEQFNGLHISHLRSPISVHPDPSSSWALELWAETRARNHEVFEMSDMGRDFDFRGPFLLPGTTLFSDFCAAVVDRYGLRDIVRKGKVVAVNPPSHDGAASSTCSSASTPLPTPPHYLVSLADGSQLCARRVVVAIGSTNIPRVPDWAQHLTPQPVPLLPGPTSNSSHATVMHQTASAAAGGMSLLGQADDTLRPGRLPRGVVLHAWDVARVFSSALQEASGLSSHPRMDSSDAHQHVAAAPGPHNAVASSGISNTFSSTGSGDGTRTMPTEPGATNQTASPEEHDSQPSSPRDVLLGPDSSASSDLDWVLPHAPTHNASLQSHLPAATPPADAPVPLCLNPSCTPLSGTRVVVVGGGLTSAQLALLAVQHGCTDVVMLLRGSLCVQQFDISARWLGRNRGGLLSDLQATAGENAQARLAALRSAGGGKGSISPEALRMLLPHVKAHTVHIVVHEEVVAADWDNAYCWSCGARGTQPHAATASTSSAQHGGAHGSAGSSGSIGGSSASCCDVHSWGAWELHLCGCGYVMQPDQVSEVLQRAAEEQGAGSTDWSKGDGIFQGQNTREAGPHGEGSGAHKAHRTAHAQGTGGACECKQRTCRSSAAATTAAGCGDAVGVINHTGCASASTSTCTSRPSLAPGLADSCCTLQPAGPTPAAEQCQWQLTDTDGVLWAHHVWVATGSVVDCGKEPLMASLSQSLGPPSDMLAGLPLLTDSLRWNRDSNVFVMGAYAALRLGPGAGNLMGARTGARLLVDVLRQEVGLKPAQASPLPAHRAQTGMRAGRSSTQAGGSGPGHAGDGLSQGQAIDNKKDCGKAISWLHKLRAVWLPSSTAHGRAQKAGGFKR